MNVTSGGQTLKLLLEDDAIVVAPGAHDPLTAKIIERLGFRAIYVTGGGVSAGHGLPDVGLVTFTEVLSSCSAIVSSVEVPVIMDADTGFGEIGNIQRAVRGFESVGVAGVHLEDQVFPKRCGYMEGSSLISIDDMKRRIDVALDARTSEDFAIIARTERRMLESYEEAVERAEAYMGAGADICFVNGIPTVAEAKAVIEDIPGPHLFNYSGTDKSPHLTVSELEQLGYRIVIFPVHAARLAARAIERMYADVKRTGSIAEWIEQMMPFDEWQKLCGVHAFLEDEARFR